MLTVGKYQGEKLVSGAEKTEVVECDGEDSCGNLEFINLV